MSSNTKYGNFIIGQIQILPLLMAVILESGDHQTSEGNMNKCCAN